jgi:hypothetical protein
VSFNHKQLSFTQSETANRSDYTLIRHMPLHPMPKEGKFLVGANQVMSVLCLCVWLWKFTATLLGGALWTSGSECCQNSESFFVQVISVKFNLSKVSPLALCWSLTGPLMRDEVKKALIIVKAINPQVFHILQLSKADSKRIIK